MSAIFGTHNLTAAYTFKQIAAAMKMYRSPVRQGRVKHTRMVSPDQDVFEMWTAGADFENALAFAVNTGLPMNEGLLWWPMSRTMWAEMQADRRETVGPRATLRRLRAHLRSVGWDDCARHHKAWLLWEGWSAAGGWEQQDVFELTVLAMRRDGFLLFDFSGVVTR